MDSKVRVQIVTYNTEPAVVEKCIGAVCAQQGFSVGENLFISVIDNSSDTTVTDKVGTVFGSKVEVIKLPKNIGFCGAHNRGVYEFLNSSAEYLLILNPDVLLTEELLSRMMHALEISQWAGAATPLLLRCDEKLVPLHPAVVDAAGMYVTPELRHFDRGSGKPLTDDLLISAKVFGGTGACLLLRRAFVLDLLLDGGVYEALTENLHPELALDRHLRRYLFDEAFFAYREDADLAWRGQLLGWGVVFAPDAVAFHTRKVLPERRAQLSPFINRLGVRNRFLLQLNNGGLYLGAVPFIMGGIWRNLVVIIGMLFKERTSLPALQDVCALFPRILARRKLLRRMKAASQRNQEKIMRWFSYSPYVEPL